jgi:hypothetical protein
LHYKFGLTFFNYICSGGGDRAQITQGGGDRTQVRTRKILNPNQCHTHQL